MSFPCTWNKIPEKVAQESRVTLRCFNLLQKLEKGVQYCCLFFAFSLRFSLAFHFICISVFLVPDYYQKQPQAFCTTHIRFFSSFSCEFLQSWSSVWVIIVQYSPDPELVWVLSRSHLSSYDCLRAVLPHRPHPPSRTDPAAPPYTTY